MVGTIFVAGPISLSITFTTTWSDTFFGTLYCLFVLGNILAIFNTAELLEISIMRRNTSEIGANKLLGINEKDSILIDF